MLNVIPLALKAHGLGRDRPKWIRDPRSSTLHLLASRVPSSIAVLIIDAVNRRLDHKLVSPSTARSMPVVVVTGTSILLLAFGRRRVRVLSSRAARPPPPIDPSAHQEGPPTGELNLRGKTSGHLTDENQPYGKHSFLTRLSLLVYSPPQPSA